MTGAEVGNASSWNVWLNHPELVDQEEWQEHAEKWRKSIDVNHNSPERWQSPARFHDGTLLPVPKNLVAHEVAKIHEFKKICKECIHERGRLALEGYQPSA